MRRFEELEATVLHVWNLPAHELDAYLSRTRLHPYTEHTLTSPEKLRSVLRDVRESGFAFASQQMESRLCTLAVPVKDIGGNFVAGMKVILQGRLVTAGEMAARFAQPLQDAAAELGSLLLP